MTRYRKSWTEVIKEVYLGEALKPIDKSVVDAFYYKKEKEGKIVSTDGDTLTKMGIGGQQIAKWVGRKIKITAVSDVKSTESIIKYIRKSIPSGILEEVEIDEKFAGWIAFYNKEKLEIKPKKGEIDSLYDAKQAAIKHFKVPKSKQGLLAIEPAHEEVEEARTYLDREDERKKKKSGKLPQSQKKSRWGSGGYGKGEEAEVDEKKAATGYDLYHKDFSSAMQHAYAHAKKKGFVVDPKEIDDKVATGPKKPSSGKTNRYALKAGKKTVHIQVANLDNKKYELNMYIEGVELTEKGTAYPATVDTLRKIVKDKQHQTVMFDKGEALVDTFTASAMLAVYDAMKKPDIKKKFENMIKSKEGFIKTQAFAMKMIK